MVKNRGGNKTKGKSRKVFRQKELGIKDLKKIDNQEYGFVLAVFIIATYSQSDMDKLIKEKEVHTAFAKSGSLINNITDEYISSSDEEDDEEVLHVENINNSELNIEDI